MLDFFAKKSVTKRCVQWTGRVRRSKMNIGPLHRHSSYLNDQNTIKLLNRTWSLFALHWTWVGSKKLVLIHWKRQTRYLWMNETGNLSNHFNGSTRSWVGKIKNLQRYNYPNPRKPRSFIQLLQKFRFFASTLVSRILAQLVMWKMVASRFHIFAWNLYVNLLPFEGEKLAKFSQLEILAKF